jgi:hypothetical protein
MYYYISSKLRKTKTSNDNIRAYLKEREVIPGKIVKSSSEINRIIAEKIMVGQPFMAGRFGATELSAISTFDFQNKAKYEVNMRYMKQWSGFFPENIEQGKKFTQLMIPLISEADIMGIWMLRFEEYYLKKYGSKELELTYLLDLEPWSAPENPWSAALAGKKVLVIHPFADTIKQQYEKRDKIFLGTSILPEFNLKVLRAVQTVANETDDRFETWFDALEWMYREALSIDFDIAIIGCGAYGFPLAAKLKKAGKSAIHLGGATQLLFGIKGKRWENDDSFLYVKKFFNDNWVYPSELEQPSNLSSVAGGVYWK